MKKKRGFKEKSVYEEEECDLKRRVCMKRKSGFKEKSFDKEKKWI